MKAKLLLALACMSIAGAFNVASAGHENCNGTIDTIEAGGVAVGYVDDRGEDDYIWIYAETNGEAGLQSGGTAALGYDDTCSHANPDTLVY